jgi:hypothetical protein
VSILSAKFWDAPVQPINLKIYAAYYNTEIRISGLAHVRFEIDGILLETLFVVTDAIDECLLRIRFLLENHCFWDLTL